MVTVAVCPTLLQYPVVGFSAAVKSFNLDMNIETQTRFILSLNMEAACYCKRTGIPNVLEDDLARDSMACPLLLEAVASLSCCAIFVAEKALRNLSMSIESMCLSV